ncbi:MAG: hypothetical protein F7O42_06935 [Opitutae bacterium]|nr:hypothetical protein [Opitutae bacterium]
MTTSSSRSPSYHEEQITKHIEKKTGQTISEIRKEPLDAKRARVEKMKGKPLKIKSEFPWIGRGNVNSRNLKESRLIDEEVDSLLK